MDGSEYPRADTEMYDCGLTFRQGDLPEGHRVAEILQTLSLEDAFSFFLTELSRGVLGKVVPLTFPLKWT